MDEPPSPNKATLNLAIGPSCFVQCDGCYNNFGNTSKRGGLITRREVQRLARMARELGFTQATVSGGDPLTHPEIEGILCDLRALDLYVKLDSVGTALLRPTAEKFFGSPTTSHHLDLGTILELVDVLGVPLDGSCEEVQRLFRRTKAYLVEVGVAKSLFGEDVSITESRRHSVVADTVEILDAAQGMEARTCVNTVVHAGNVTDVGGIARLLCDHPPDEWQLFEFQATGPLASRTRHKFALDRTTGSISMTSREPVDQLFPTAAHSFAEAVRTATAAVGDAFTVTGKSKSSRLDAYLLVNDAGDLWRSGTEQDPYPTRLANVRDGDRELAASLSAFEQRTRPAG